MSGILASMADSTTAAPLGPPTPANPSIGAESASSGLVRVVSPAALSASEAQDRARKRLDSAMMPAMDDLAAYVRRQFDIMRRHRDGGSGWTQRMIESMRMFNGEYDPSKLAQIEEFGGSKVYARVVSVKCRGATALLRDIYMNVGARPWGIDPTPVPTLPENQLAEVAKLVEAEAALAAQAAQAGTLDPTTGQPLQAPSEEAMVARRTQLETAALDGARKKAREEAKEAEDHLDDMLVEGGFYKALAEFLADLPRFPFACIRGPVVHMVNDISWKVGPDGKKTIEKKPRARMFWKRVSPFDIWWTPGASSVDSCDFVLRERKSRAEIAAMRGVEGYRNDMIDAVLTYYEHGYTESPDGADSTRADQESRENPHLNESGMYDCLEWHGSISGKLLREFGMKSPAVPDEDKEYTVQLWMVGQYVLKVHLAPSPRERPPYYITSFDKVPGTLVGNSIPDMLSDVQDVCNASLRSLVNNMAMSSGPQVGIFEDLISAGEDTTTIHPWKIWKFSQRPGAGMREPVTFFQPNSNAQQLLAVYEKFTQIADEISAIPRYITGSERMGGAGRTASGLAMLMGNASKMLQTVAANIDLDVFEPMLQFLYDLLMLTDTSGRLKGDERIRVKGVTVAMQRETERQRQIEMLQATANPIDMQIVGLRGRGALLRSVSRSLGLDGEVIVPSDEELVQREKAMAAAAALAASEPKEDTPEDEKEDADEAAAQAQGSQQGGAETGPRAIQGPRTNLQQQPPGA